MRKQALVENSSESKLVQCSWMGILQYQTYKCFLCPNLAILLLRTYNTHVPAHGQNKLTYKVTCCSAVWYSKGQRAKCPALVGVKDMGCTTRFF